MIQTTRTNALRPGIRFRQGRALRGLATAATALMILGAPALAQGWGPQPGWGPGPGWGPAPGWGQQGPWGGPGPGGFGPGSEGPGHGGQKAPKPSLIEVTGSGQASVAPDLAEVTVGVTIQAPTAGEAMRQNAGRQRAVIDALYAQGIEARDVQTSNLSLSPVQNYPDNQPPVITGYRAGNQVTVRVRDLPKLGAILDSLVTAGANEVQGITFNRDDAGEVEADARRDAVRNARERAEVIADAAGQRLGRLVSISDVGGSAPPMPMRMQAMAADASPPPPVETGELSITAGVTATWEMLPDRGRGGPDEGRGPDRDRPHHGPDAGPEPDNRDNGGPDRGPGPMNPPDAGAPPAERGPALLPEPEATPPGPAPVAPPPSN